MSTRNIVPRADGEGGLGTAAKNWNEVRAKHFYKNGVELYSSDAYSTTEQRIGTWIDGKPLYQITINMTAPSSESPTEVDLSSYNISRIVDLKGMLYDTGHVYRDIPFVYGSNAVAVVFESYKLKLYVTGTVCQNADCYITLQYTKTTD